MIYLILTILSSAMISIFMRYSEQHISAKIPMLSVNYLICMALTLWQSEGAALRLPEAQAGLTLGLGIINGAVFLLALVLIQYTIYKSGVVLSSVFSKLGSLVVPLVVAVACFGEIPTVVQLAGAALSALAILLLNGRGTEHKTTGLFSLMLLFLTQGAASALSKVFEQTGGAQLFDHFLFYTFASALLFSIVVCVKRKEWPGKWELLFGLLIGIPNFFSSRLLLLALNALPAVIVYPILGVSGIVVVSLAGVVLFRERLRKQQWLGILVVLLAVLLLNL